MNSIRDNPVRDASAPPICILGVRFDNLSIPETLDAIERMIATRKPHYVVTANVDFVVQAQQDVELRRIFFDAHLVLCDGTPLVWASRLLGNPLRERVAGADIVPLLLDRSEEKSYRVFFLGAAPQSIERAVANVQRRHPRLRICGFYSPPFNPLLEMDHAEIRKRVQAANPDLLLVSLGCPKQEKWVAMNYRTLGVPVTVGVGATIDFLAGQFKRAPLWMQRAGVEWIFRLLQEPKRLYRRYSKDIRVFGIRILNQLWTVRRRGTHRLNKLNEQTATEPVSNRSFYLKLPECFDTAEAKRTRTLWGERRTEDCFIDVSQVQFIDSAGLGVLMQMQQQITSVDKPLVLVAPSRAITEALELMRLDTFFACAPTVAQAEEILRSREQERLRRVALDADGAFRALVWYGEITAANADDVWERTRNYMTQAASIAPSSTEPLVVDMSVVRFIDSSGLGLMVRVRKFARQAGLALRFTNLQPPVMNVLQIARLEEFLLDQKQSRSGLISKACEITPTRQTDKIELAGSAKLNHRNRSARQTRSEGIEPQPTVPSEPTISVSVYVPCTGER